MSSFCVICSDRFRDSEHVVATTCGHIYHFSCITRWLGENKTCPECRSILRENRLLRLYFNVQHDDSIVSSFDSEIITLRKTLEKKDLTIESLNDKINGIREYFSTTEEKYVKELSKYQEKTERLERSVRHLSSVEKNVNKLEQENRQLRSNIEGMKDVQTLVSGCQKDVQDMVDKCVQEKDFQQLATLCVVMKRELNKALESKSKLRDDVGYLTKQKGALKKDANSAIQVGYNGFGGHRPVLN
ncbi:E3 ubiquitin-protein ligase TRAIP-like [Uloborus diversus]|uniref:E3 ubiquitin-protein ligase TRAIP-like n=1 Tax=Uloborus diversus TaxID=327109 RepID=UPI0024093B83|nr:E3 ubiquitin-protein ligase TRAIP-like [Uloborus diversus]